MPQLDIQKGGKINCDLFEKGNGNNTTFLANQEVAGISSLHFPWLRKGKGSNFHQDFVDNNDSWDFSRLLQLFVVNIDVRVKSDLEFLNTSLLSL